MPQVIDSIAKDFLKFAEFPASIFFAVLLIILIYCIGKLWGWVK